MKKRPMFLWYIICAVILAAALLFGLYYRLVLRKVIAFTYAYPPMARIYIYLGNPALRFALAGLVGGFAVDRIHLPRWLAWLLPLCLIFTLAYILAVAAVIADAAPQNITMLVNDLAMPYCNWVFLPLGFLAGLGYGGHKRQR